MNYFFSGMMLVGLISSSKVYSIEIEGEARYKKQVRACLGLISKKAQEDYVLIKNSIGIITQSNRSGMRAWENPPRYEMSDKTAFHSLTWCAGTIAHDAYHSFLYQKHAKPNSKLPYDKWAGFEAEKKAIAFQIEVMKKIGASDLEINYLKSLDGTHGDVNKDGKLTQEDYEARDW